ncbi:hypothetical protein GALMADRAFT_216475 [Galerina marginata CBS 339.88]|uniref:Uncharacterized protein n=1 Tax=Galerina marginata (strain CBS 339.88) TaxID=685588 RepID=A0A067S968_GALM3|nr:hypothetical protein GALMADRAFT_216475 [Galerina marginata CBS 339.88]
MSGRHASSVSLCQNSLDCQGIHIWRGVDAWRECNASVQKYEYLKAIDGLRTSPRRKLKIKLRREGRTTKAMARRGELPVKMQRATKEPRDDASNPRSQLQSSGSNVAASWRRRREPLIRHCVWVDDLLERWSPLGWEEYGADREEKGQRTRAAIGYGIEISSLVWYRIGCSAVQRELTSKGKQNVTEYP